MKKTYGETFNEEYKKTIYNNNHIESKSSSNIEKLFENFNGSYEPIDITFGKPVGNEIW